MGQGKRFGRETENGLWGRGVPASAFWLWNPEQHPLGEELGHKTCLLQAIPFLSCPRHPFRVLMQLGA